MIGFREYINESANAKTVFEGLKKYLPLVSDKYKSHVEQHLDTLKDMTGFDTTAESI